MRIARRLADHVDQRRVGEVVAGEVGFVLRLPGDPERVRVPDVAFVSRERLPGARLPEKFIAGPPDLTVEILSPSDNPVEAQ